MELDSVLTHLRNNLCRTLSKLPQDKDGNVTLKPSEVGVALLTSAFAVARQLGCTREQLDTVVEAAMPPAPVRLFTTS